MLISHDTLVFHLSLISIYFFQTQCVYIMSDVKRQIIKIYQMLTQKQGTTSTNHYKTEATTNFILSLHQKFSFFHRSNEKVSDNQNQEVSFQARNIYQKSSNSSQGNYQTPKKQRLLRKKSSKQIQLIFYNQQPGKGRKNSRSQSISGASSGKPKLQNQKIFCSVGKPNIQSSRKKTHLQEKQGEEDCKIYKDGGWSKTKIMILTNRVAFFECTFFLSDLQKIKILPSTNSSNTKNQNMIKLQARNQIHLISLSLDKKLYEVPTAYHIFAKLISKKLSREKISSTNTWQKSEHMLKSATDDSYIYGNILKKSQVLGNWETRFVVIKKDGIYSYKDCNTQAPHSFYINNSNIKYIWTRFDIHEKFLVIKIKHGVYKTEFGIPITNYLIRNGSNWLYNFYRAIPLLQTSKINSAQK